MSNQVLEALDNFAGQLAGRVLSTDEVADVRGTIDEGMRKLERIEYKSGDDYLLLKWGTLKSWEVHSDAGKALSDRYVSLGSSLSSMTQKDTDEQKQLICEIIDECNGTIQNDWDGDYYTKQQAKEYVMGYAS